MPDRLQVLARLSPGPVSRSALFFAGFYLYVYLQIDPRLLYQAQEPVFFWGWPFLAEFLSYPGGLLEYLAALLSQSYSSSWLGALVIALSAWLLCLATRVYLAAVSGLRLHLLPFVPAIFLLVLHQHYLYPLAPELGLLAALGGVLAYARLPLARPRSRVLAFAVLSALLYYVVAAPLLLGTVLCGLFEALKRRRPFLGLACLLAGLLIPYLAAVHVFGFLLPEAYGRSLPFYGAFFLEGSRLPGAAVALCLFFPLAGLGAWRWCTWNARRSGAAEAIAFPGPGFRGRARGALQTLVLLAATGVAAFAASPGDYKALIQIDYHAGRRDWPQVLQAARRLRAYNTLAVYDINRALCHLGRLPEDLFSYPQRKGVEIFLPTPEAPANLRAMSEILLELGQVNIAEHLALEAVEIYGDRPSLLQQLVRINLLKGRTQAARTFLGLLEKSPLYRDWAQRYRAALEADSTLSGDAELQGIRAAMVAEDYVGYFTPEDLLQQLLAQNRRNQMAFQYLMAHYLLTGQLEQVAANIAYLNNFPERFPYPDIPRPCEEALLLYLAKARAGQGAVPNLSRYGRRISPQTSQRFTEFNASLARYQGDAAAARQALVSAYGSTYWFYYLFRGPGQADLPAAAK